jgi:hypothetical protein
VEILQHAVQYKEKWAPIFEQHERENLDPPDIFPTRTISLSMEPRAKSGLTDRSAGNKRAREKPCESNQLNHCGGFSR